MHIVGSDTATNFANRIVTLTTRLLALIMLYAYSAMLLSYLLLRNPEAPFEDFAGLRAHPDYSIGIVNNSGYVHRHYQVSQQ